MIFSISMVILVILFQDRSFNTKIAIQKLKADYQKGLLKSSLQSQESERERIAQDLHDEIGPVLSAVKINLNLLANKIKQSEDPTSLINDTLKDVDETIDTIRRISKDLLPATLKNFGLSPAFNELCVKINNPDFMKINLIEYGIPFRFETSRELGLYRIGQELLNNALKHSDAENVDLQLNWHPKNINLTIKDNGKGFDFYHLNSITPWQKGIGLNNIEARINAINGFVNYHSKIGRGTEVEVGLNFE